MLINFINNIPLPNLLENILFTGRYLPAATWACF